MRIETKPFRILEIPIALGWLIGGVVFLVVYSVLFFKIWFVWLSWKKLHIPMGQAGAIYPVFFLGPVFVASLIYQALVQSCFVKLKSNLSTRFVLSLVLPAIIVSIMLIVFCPIDDPNTNSYIKEFFKAVFK